MNDATECAQRILAQHEACSPSFRRVFEAQPPELREIIVTLMAMAYVDGELHGAQKLAGQIGGGQ